MKKGVEAKVSILLFVALSTWWLLLRLKGVSNESNDNQLFAASYGIMALWGGIWGLAASSKWGGLRSVMGKAIALFSLGLFFQEFGQIAYSYYIYYLHEPVPYPSLGDLGYFGSIPFYIYGVFLLAKASGVKVSLGSIKNKIQAVFVPALLLLISYLVFLKDYSFDWNQPLTVFLDFSYPLGQAIYISIALLAFLLSRGILGGIMKKRVLFILLALLFQYLSDWTFLYQANKETWYAGGFNDYMYLFSYFLMTLALLELKNVYTQLKHTS